MSLGSEPHVFLCHSSGAVFSSLFEKSAFLVGRTSFFAKQSIKIAGEKKSVRTGLLCSWVKVVGSARALRIQIGNSAQGVLLHLTI